jgi:hypothetical protein
MPVLPIFALLALNAVSPNGSLNVRDLQGRPVQPLSSLPKPATVFIFIASDCPICNSYTAEMNRIERAFPTVRMVAVFEDPSLTPKAARSHTTSFGLRLAGLLDPTHSLADRLGARITPEAVVLLADGRTAYQGRIDDTYPSVGRRRSVTTRYDLRDALSALTTGKPVAETKTTAVGCFIRNG